MQFIVVETKRPPYEDILKETQPQQITSIEVTFFQAGADVTAVIDGVEGNILGEPNAQYAYKQIVRKV